MEATTFKGVSSFLRSYSPFIALTPYIASNAKTTSSSSLSRGNSSNNDRLDISASKEGGGGGGGTLASHQTEDPSRTPQLSFPFRANCVTLGRLSLVSFREPYSALRSGEAYEPWGRWQYLEPPLLSKE